MEGNHLNPMLTKILVRKQPVVLLFLFFCLKIQAQKALDITPLHYYLQANFDTTIILHDYSAWSYASNYSIISIRNGQMNAFTYKAPYTRFNGRAMPRELADKFIKRQVAFDFTAPDTNAYFIPMFLRNMEEKNIKYSLDSLQLWQVADDKKDGHGCNNTCYIFDSTEYVIWLITKNEIKKLDFYDPAYFEACCTGRKGRQADIRFVGLMNTIFH